MDAYAYRAALYCGPCATKIRADLTNSAPTPQDLKYLNGCGDSDRFPQGPYSNGGGESDCPEHCAKCMTFLENPLTTDGVDYARDLIEDFDQRHTGNAATIETWRDFYSDVLRP